MFCQSYCSIWLSLGLNCRGISAAGAHFLSSSPGLSHLVRHIQSTSSFIFSRPAPVRQVFFFGWLICHQPSPCVLVQEFAYWVLFFQPGFVAWWYQPSCIAPCDQVPLDLFSPARPILFSCVLFHPRRIEPSNIVVLLIRNQRSWKGPCSPVFEPWQSQFQFSSETKGAGVVAWIMFKRETTMDMPGSVIGQVYSYRNGG